MATALEPNIRPEIEAVLARLRAKIRTYVFLEGTAWVIAALGAVFWITLALNWAYFKVSNLELPVWFRMVIDIAAISFLAGCLMIWLVQRLLKNMRTKALALVLERRFPELDDRLITAVEVAESTTGKESAFTTTLLHRTIADVSEAAHRLEVSDVFAKRPLRSAMLAAVVFTASIAGFGFLNQRAFGYWYQAFFGLREEYWDRETLLVPRVIASSDERVKEFREVDGEIVYKHPRGEDFTLSVIVPKPDEKAGKDWVVPADVEWDYTLSNGRGGATLNMSKTGDREFRQTVSNLLDSMTFSIRGHDFVNRRPIRVQIVDPPVIDQMKLERNYPDYTGLNQEFAPRDEDERKQREREKLVLGSHVSLPMETEIIMEATSNKPLVGVRVEGQNFRLTVKAARKNGKGLAQPGSAKLELLAQDGVPMLELPLAQGFADRCLKAGEKTFHLPLVLATDAALKMMPPGLPLAADLERGFLVNPVLQVAEIAAWHTTPIEQIPLPSNALLRIFLEDTDDILSSEPSRMTINGIVDEPPEHSLDFIGIGEFITDKAQIPVQGKITDDYGVAKARFEYQLMTDDGQLLTGPDWVPVEFENPPNAEPKEYKLQLAHDAADPKDDEPFERFDVSKILFQDANGPRGIKAGDVLVLTVYSEDGDNINGPHIVRQKPKPEYIFKVVSRDELMAILYQKELGLLSRFQQIITEVEGVEADLAKAGTDSDQFNKLRDKQNRTAEEQKTMGELDSSLTAVATRSIQQIAKNKLETYAVEASFLEILDEMANNGIESASMVAKLHELIIDPLHRIGENDFPRVDRSLVRYKNVQENGQNANQAIGESHDDVAAMLENMQKVLGEMQELASYQELAKNVQQMINETEAAKQKAQKEAADQLKKLNLE